VEFIVGDAVRLKAYPAHSMKVIEVQDDWVVCRWFERSAVQEGAFPAGDLEVIPETAD
jgi:uncharacterized protein YodC (DUF2158 family)